MKLLDRNGLRVDPFVRVAAAHSRAHRASLVPLADLAEAFALRRGGAVGVEVANTTYVAELAPHFDDLSLIAIAFPSFGDGRGFSLARRLRRAGYSSLLRAVGPLIADQASHAFACGFDEIELPDELLARQPWEQWRRALEVIPLGYQPGLARPTSIFEQRRLARAGAADA